MNSLKKLLLVIVATGLVGSSFAIDETRGPAAPASALAGQADANGVRRALTVPESVMERGMPAEANYLARAVAVNYAPGDGIHAGIKSVSRPGGITAPETGTAAAAPPGPGFTVAMPEPTEWMQLLCGLMVAGFIARRRTNLVAD
jgi:hypothetical protein